MSFQAQGPTTTGAATTRLSPYVTFEYVADASIGSGAVVALDTGNTSGRLVVECPIAATADHRIVGIYTGIGGKGAANATYGGNDALVGDAIEVLVYGTHPKARVDGTPTGAVDGDALTPSATVAGELESLSTTFDAGDQAVFVCLEANGSTVAARAVFVRAL